MLQIITFVFPVVGQRTVEFLPQDLNIPENRADTIMVMRNQPIYMLKRIIFL